MSALPHETPARAYANPHRLETDEGPQTLAELRAALALISPAELVAFNAKLDAARFGAAQAAVITEARHLVALRTRTEVQAAIAASLAGETQTAPVSDLYAFLEGKGSAA
ncbi:hypothetical protein HW130_32355 [Streptomyces sp. PKU-EA00015]|uniref:hypothetical protein n=1 Tax=Streptomyces sp. PKU-EA00015 TaxID=2748326 RepID=UPI0015A4ADBA|nr:hypothetical protein [Streptomyces sp. PKU-EA00015]NWF30885.1 hypothetical protein [Streptomyces sp. PKU-EA00015]